MGQLMSLAVREGYLGKTKIEGKTGNYFSKECGHPSGWFRAKEPRSASWFGPFQAALVESYETTLRNVNNINF